MDPTEARLYQGESFAGKSGSYRVGSLIGSGGFGGVFEGVDQATGDDVAIKILAFHGRPADAQLEFDAEIKLLGLLLDCSNVVTLLDESVFDVVLAKGGLSFAVPVPFMVLDRATIGLEGLLAARHQLSWLDRMGLYRDVVKGCHQMHLKRLVHRDVKSANALVYSDEPNGRLTDLGRSKDAREPARFLPNRYQAGRGDLRFAPPELLWGLGETTPDTHCRTDLYLLGSLFYEFAAASGITAAALRDPRSWLHRAASLPDQAAREQDFTARLPDLYGLYSPVYMLFEGELPRAVATDAVALLRQLTDPDPSKREPARSVRGLPIRWDLQWLLHRIDILVKRLEIEANRAKNRSGRYRRRKVVTP